MTKKRVNSTPNNLSSTSPKWRQPSESRMREIDNILWNTETLHIYCDASPAVLDKRVIGIATTFVWGGNVVVRSRKYYERCPITNANVLGEIVALLHGLTQIPSVIRSEGFAPQKIKVLTDYNVAIEWLSGTVVPPVDFADHVNQTMSQMRRLQVDFPNLSVVHLGQERQYNPFYRAAHNAARKEVDIYSGRNQKRERK